MVLESNTSIWLIIMIHGIALHPEIIQMNSFSFSDKASQGFAPKASWNLCSQQERERDVCFKCQSMEWTLRRNATWHCRIQLISQSGERHQLKIKFSTQWLSTGIMWLLERVYLFVALASEFPEAQMQLKCSSNEAHKSLAVQGRPLTNIASIWKYEYIMFIWIWLTSHSIIIDDYNHPHSFSDHTTFHHTGE